MASLEKIENYCKEHSSGCPTIDAEDFLYYLGGGTPKLENPFYFYPTLEEPSDIIKHTSPSGKKVLTVAAFGYPLEFIAQGASQVCAYDISDDSIAWNLFMRSALERMSYEDCMKLFSNDFSSEEMQHLTRPLIDNGVPIDHQYRATTLVDRFAREGARDKILRFYPQTRDKVVFAEMQDFVKDGQYGIVQRDIYELIGEIANRGYKFDVVYLSSIRGMELDKYFAENFLPGKLRPKKTTEGQLQREIIDIPFRNKEKKLFNALGKVVSSGGVVYSSFVPGVASSSFFPMREIHGFSREMYKSSSDGKNPSTGIYFDVFGKRNRIEILRRK